MLSILDRLTLPILAIGSAHLFSPKTHLGQSPAVAQVEASG
jgi:hypothetical protein